MVLAAIRVGEESLNMKSMKECMKIS